MEVRPSGASGELVGGCGTLKVPTRATGGRGGKLAGCHLEAEYLTWRDVFVSKATMHAGVVVCWGGGGGVVLFTTIG